MIRWLGRFGQVGGLETLQVNKRSCNGDKYAQLFCCFSFRILCTLAEIESLSLLKSWHSSRYSRKSSLLILLTTFILNYSEFLFHTSISFINVTYEATWVCPNKRGPPAFYAVRTDLYLHNYMLPFLSRSEYFKCFP